MSHWKLRNQAYKRCRVGLLHYNFQWLCVVLLGFLRHSVLNVLFKHASRTNRHQKCGYKYHESPLDDWRLEKKWIMTQKHQLVLAFHGNSTRLKQCTYKIIKRNKLNVTSVSDGFWIIWISMHAQVHISLSHVLKEGNVLRKVSCFCSAIVDGMQTVRDLTKTCKICSRNQNA